MKYPFCEDNNLREGVKRLLLAIDKVIVETKAESYKKCLEKIEQRDVSESDFYIMIKRSEFDNLLEELMKE